LSKIRGDRQDNGGIATGAIRGSLRFLYVVRVPLEA
jgi:hypothetical protein